MIAVEDIAAAPPTTTATAGAMRYAGRRDRGDDARGEHHLRAADAEHFAAHRDQSGQGEFETQGEHQEDDAEVREQSGRLRVGGERERVRAKQHADDEVAQDRGQCELAHRGDDANRRGQQDQNLQQRIVLHRGRPK